ncbi:MAG: hypothetical protein PVS3B1_12460 [Ktedonobacteraceae bacterium]
MFTILKQQFKQRIAHFIYNFLKTWYDMEHWTLSVSCIHCTRLIAADGHFCPYCGQTVLLPVPAQITTNHSSLSTLTTNSETIHPEPVTIMLPRFTIKRHFLNYVRTRRGQAGPATQAHRSFQDHEQQRY